MWLKDLDSSETSLFSGGMPAGHVTMLFEHRRGFAMPLTIPADLSGPIEDGLRFFGDAPATRRFLKFTRRDARWIPAWPRRLVRLAMRLGIVIDVPHYFDLLATGFRGYNRPYRIGVALIVVLRARLTGYGVPAHLPISSISDTSPRRWGAPESVLRPSWHASPIAPAPAPEAAPSLPDAPPAGPAPGSTPGRPSVQYH
jgi:hypothetical protein